MHVLRGVSLELEQVLRGILKVQPRPLGRLIKTTVRVAGPAVVHAVEVIVGVRVGVVLVAVETQVVSVEVVLGLQSLGKRTRLLHPQVRLEGEVRHANSKQHEHRHSGKLLSDKAGDD